MSKLVNAQDVDMWLHAAIDANHLYLGLRSISCTGNQYWGTDGCRIHISSQKPFNYNPHAFETEARFLKFHESSDKWDIAWQGVLPASNLYKGADYACCNCPDPEDNPMQFKGYLFNPKFVKDAILVMHGDITAQLLVSPENDKRACLHLVRHELSNQFEAYIMCRLP